MSSESKSHQIWARSFILNSGKPFAQETLQQVGLVEGITVRRSDGRLTTTAEMTEEILRHIGATRVHICLIRRVDQGILDDEVQNDNPGSLN